MRKLLITAIVAQIFFVSKAISQSKGEIIREDKKNIPYRPKIAEISYYQLSEYNTRSTSGKFGDANSEVEKDSQLKVRLGIPLITKETSLFGIQLKYDRHNFLHDFGGEPLEYELYNHIETKSFTSLGARFLFQKSLDNNREITMIAGAEIKSDKLVLNRNTTKYYAHFAYAKQLNSRTKIGGGMLVSYTLGRPQIYPLFTYEHHLSSQWTLDLKLPKQAAIRYKANDRFYITALAEIKGWRYALHNTELSPNNALTLQKCDMNFGLSFEHEIHDWLWFGFDVGFSRNLRYFLSEPGDNRYDALINLSSRDTPYLKAGFYIVPPRKFYQ